VTLLFRGAKCASGGRSRSPQAERDALEAEIEATAGQYKCNSIGGGQDDWAKKNRICYIGGMIGFKERTWRITLYKRELQPDGRVADVEIETFDEARAKVSSGDIRDSHGRLVFVTAQGKEVLSGGIAFVAREI